MECSRVRQLAWQTVNAVRRPQSRRFTRGFLIVTPGLTIRDRLRVLKPNDPDSYYRSRDLVPHDLLPDLDRAKIVITNYHAFRRRERIEIAKGGRSLLQGRGPVPDTRESEGRMLRRVMPELMGVKAEEDGGGDGGPRRWRAARGPRAPCRRPARRHRGPEGRMDRAAAAAHTVPWPAPFAARVRQRRKRPVPRASLPPEGASARGRRDDAAARHDRRGETARRGEVGRGSATRRGKAMRRRKIGWEPAARSGEAARGLAARGCEAARRLAARARAGGRGTGGARAGRPRGVAPASRGGAAAGTGGSVAGEGRGRDAPGRRRGPAQALGKLRPERNHPPRLAHHPGSDARGRLRRRALAAGAGPGRDPRERGAHPPAGLRPAIPADAPDTAMQPGFRSLYFCLGI